MDTAHHASAYVWASALFATGFLWLLSLNARADSASVSGGLGTITVEATKKREAIKHEVNTFINSITIRGFDESVARWQPPVCPLVAGLSRDLGEFVLRRLSLAARDANVRLAGASCSANFFVVVTMEPDVLLKNWRARDPTMFNDERGAPGINRFLSSTQPIRIWYNAGAGCSGGVAADLAFALGSKAFISEGAYPAACHNPSTLGSKLIWQSVRNITSVIVIADALRVQSLNIGQFADYVAMVGLAEIRLDQDPGAAPTILRLFADTSDARPQSLSRWDQSFLKALYNSSSESTMQVSTMKTKMLAYIAQ